MSYKNSMKKRIEAISIEDAAFDDKVIQEIKKVYKQALDESRITGESIESVTYEILEGIEELLLDHNEVILAKVSDIMIDTIHQSAQACIANHEEKVVRATADLQESVAKEKTHLLESMKAFQDFSQEKSLKHFMQHLHKKEEKIKELLEHLSKRLLSHQKEDDMLYHEI